ncbi:MAG: CBS domain-containing protein [Sphingomonadales bacterium]|nr:MAG: CBS domain-containing protein [Sphingomonadales bacterium]TNF03331.1 MAG: CBS domain-containing protein [Sphingomonadales bacterium]
MTIAAILNGKGHEVVQIAPDASLQEAAGLLAERRIGCVPVVDGGKVIGILSERDIVRSVGKGGGGALAQPVRDLMTSPAVTITSDVAVISALSLMTRRRIRHLPVLDGSRMVGFVSIGDLVKYRIDRIEAEAAAMRDYIQSV